MESRHPKSDYVYKKLVKPQNRGAYFFREVKTEVKPLEKSSNDALKNAKGFASSALPWVTAAGLVLLTEKEHKSMGVVDLSGLKYLGLPLAMGGAVIDVIKAPICLVVASEEAVRAGVCKLASYVFENGPGHDTVNQVFKSFLIRLQITASILVKLELEKEDILDRTLKSGQMEKLIGLTLLYSAYDSRHCSEKEGIVLATGEIFLEKHCPSDERYKQLFKKTVELKNLIKEVLASLNLGEGEQALREEANVICKWIRIIYRNKLLKEEEAPEYSSAEIAIINKIMDEIKNLARLGKDILPEPVSSVPSSRRVR
jgi:hypothetical protein